MKTREGLIDLVADDEEGGDDDWDSDDEDDGDGEEEGDTDFDESN